jgi:hypothetical protein
MKRVILHPADAYKICKPVGDFDFGVGGVKANGSIQVAHDNMTQEQASLQMTVKTTKPRSLFKTFDKLEVWNKFVPWQHIHWLSSGHNARRVSVFFRPLREDRTSNNITYKEGKQNWEDLRHIK